MPEAAVREAWAAVLDATGLAEGFGVSRLAAQLAALQTHGGTSVTDALGFLPGMTERLRSYVYALTDPRFDDRIFYVGKGVGDRVYQHAARARVVDAAEGRRGLKLATINEIHRAGHEVGVQIIRHGLTSDEALMVEAAAIDALRLAGVELTNLVAGQARGMGWQHLDDLRARYAAPPVEIEPNDRVILIRINRLFEHGMTDERLYEATRQWWKVSPRNQGPARALLKQGVDSGRLVREGKPFRYVLAGGAEQATLFDAA